MKLREDAAIRLFCMVVDATHVRNKVTAADMATSLADARTAACVARGVPIDYIDPASGLDCSPRAYRIARSSWVGYLADRPDKADTVEQALETWIRRRPDVVAAVETALESGTS